MIKDFVFELFSFIGELNYGVVFLLSALESTCFPVIIPVETIIIPMGYYAYLGTKSLPLLIFSTTSGIVLGCIINYWFARVLGRNFIYKHSKLLHIKIEKLQELERKFLSHGRLLMFIGRFIPIPAFKHIITIPAGMAKMPMGIFIFYNMLGGLIFSTSMLLLGYFFGGSEALVGNIHKIIEKITVVCIVLLVTYCAIKIVIFFIKKRKNRTNIGKLNMNSNKYIYDFKYKNNDDFDDLFDASEMYFKNRKKNTKLSKRNFIKKRKEYFEKNNNYDYYDNKKKIFKKFFKKNKHFDKFTKDDIDDLTNKDSFKREKDKIRRKRSKK